MTDAKRNGIRRLTGCVVAFGALLAAAATNPGCGGGAGNTSMTSGSSVVSGVSSSSGGTGGTGGTGGMSCNSGAFQAKLAPGANGGFTDAFDATPNAHGTTVYFTAIDAKGAPGVLKQDICPAGAVSTVFTGGAFEAPFGISIGTDDATLYVADLSAAEDATDTTGAKDKGALFSLPAAGGAAPTILVASVAPRGVTVVRENGADQVYFTGFDKANKKPGVFKVAAAGGAVTVLAEGPPFSDPAGVVVSSSGDIYVVDTSGSTSQLGNIIVVKGGSATELVPNLQVGYPAGIAITQDDKQLLVSGMNPSATSDVLFLVDVATQVVTNNTTSIGGFGEAAGLHRAHKADVFAWADTKAKPMGLTGTGTVFVIK